MHLYLGQWEWKDHAWQAPGGNNAGALDLRPLKAQAARGGVPKGYGLFTYPEEVFHPLLGVHLGDDIDATLPSKKRSAVSDRLGRVHEKRGRNLIREIMLRGDAEGVRDHKPLHGNLRTDLCIHLGGLGCLTHEKFEPEHPGFDNTIRQFQTDYKKAARLLSKGHLAKTVGAKSLEIFGEMTDDTARALVPAGYSPVWAEPTTNLVDTFEDTNNTLLENHNPTPFNWGSWGALTGSLEIFNNQLREPTLASYGEYRAEFNLSTADHWAEAVIRGSWPTGNDTTRLTIRNDSTDRTHYGFLVGDISLNRIYQRIAGAFTTLDSSFLTLVNDQVWRFQVDGSTITTYANSAERQNITNTTITGFLRAGVCCQGTGEADTWQAQDIAAPSTSIAALLSANQRVT